MRNSIYFYSQGNFFLILLLNYCIKFRFQKKIESSLTVFSFKDAWKCRLLNPTLEGITMRGDKLRSIYRSDLSSSQNFTYLSDFLYLCLEILNFLAIIGEDMLCEVQVQHMQAVQCFPSMVQFNVIQFAFAMDTVTVSLVLSSVSSVHCQPQPLACLVVLSSLSSDDRFQVMAVLGLDISLGTGSSCSTVF